MLQLFQGCLLRQGARRWNAGYHPDLAIMLGWTTTPLTGNDQQSQLPSVTHLAVDEKSDLVFIGTNHGAIVVDCIQKACVLRLTTSELFACIDPSTLKTVLKKAHKEQKVTIAANDQDKNSEDENEINLPTVPISKQVFFYFSSSSSYQYQNFQIPFLKKFGGHHLHAIKFLL